MLFMVSNLPLAELDKVRIGGRAEVWFEETRCRPGAGSIQAGLSRRGVAMRLGKGNVAG